MKKILKTTALFNLILLYSFIISFNSSNNEPLHSSLSSSKQTESSSSCLFITKGLFSHSAQNESSVKVLAKLPCFLLKNTFTYYSDLTKTTEYLFSTRFLQYILNSRNILIRHRKANIIFPFHFFW